MPSRRRLAVSRKFADALQRVRWADEQILELKARSSKFFNPETHRRFKEVDPKSSHVIDKIKLDPLPDPILRNVVQIIESLRFALDYAASAVTPAQWRKKTYFPFGDTKRDMDATIKSNRCKHIPDEIKVLFATFKPYKRGNPPLWALNKICNTTKHRTIIEPGISVKDFSFEDFWKVGETGALPFAPRWDRRKNEIVISRALGKGTIHHDVEFSVGIKFGKVPVFSGMPVPSVLRYLASRVEKILWLTESEARKIGIVK
jgi:hypothetical protein